MMTELTTIGSRDILGKTVTAFGTVENPLFLAKDVAEWIEHSNVTVMVQSVDADEVKILKLNETLVNPVPETSTKQCLGQAREYTFLTENGLYEVLFLSRKPVAKEFKKGVKQLLHDLRTGKAQRRKNAQGNKRKMCHQTRRNGNENRIQKKNLLTDCVSRQSDNKFFSTCYLHHFKC